MSGAVCDRAQSSACADLSAPSSSCTLAQRGIHQEAATMDVRQAVLGQGGAQFFFLETRLGSDAV